MAIEVEINITDHALNFTNLLSSELPIHENLEWLDMYTDSFDLFDYLINEVDVDPEAQAARITTLLSLGINRMRNNFADTVIDTNPEVLEHDRHSILAYFGRDCHAGRIILLDNYANWKLNGLIHEWANENDFILVYPTECGETDLTDFILKQRCLSYSYYRHNDLLN